MKIVVCFVASCVLAILGLGPVSAACSGKAFRIEDDKVFDAKTKLTWMRCSLGLVWRNHQHCSGDMRFVNFIDAKRAALAAGNGWRVPSISELGSLIDEGCKPLKINTKVFPDVVAKGDMDAPYWSATDSGLAGLIYYADFVSGIVDGHTKGYLMSVRLVRGPAL